MELIKKKIEIPITKNTPVKKNLNLRFDSNTASENFISSLAGYIDSLLQMGVSTGGVEGIDITLQLFPASAAAGCQVNAK